VLHHARRHARFADGELVLLQDQDRALWDRAQLAEGRALIDRAIALRGAGPYVLQAAIAALHCQAARAEDTVWRQIVRLYEILEGQQPSAIVSLNRAVAIAMVDGPQRGLALVDELASSGDLDEYHLLHAARADLLRRMGDNAESVKSYRRALALAGNESERRFLERRLRDALI